MLKNIIGIYMYLQFVWCTYKKKIYYRLNMIRPDGIMMIEVAVPRQIWEIEYMEDGTIEIEKFISDRSF